MYSVNLISQSTKPKYVPLLYLPSEAVFCSMLHTITVDSGC